VETGLHNLLKTVAFSELEKEGYDLFVEPSESPVVRLSWSFYRPDILGILSSETEFRMILVECETDPRRSRVRGKGLRIRRYLTFQRRLNEACDARLLLVVPSGKLRSIDDSDVRRLWEIWIVNYDGRVVCKIPRKTMMEGE